MKQERSIYLASLREAKEQQLAKLAQQDQLTIPAIDQHLFANRYQRLSKLIEPFNAEQAAIRLPINWLYDWRILSLVWLLSLLSLHLAQTLHGMTILMGLSLMGIAYLLEIALRYTTYWWQIRPLHRWNWQQLEQIAPWIAGEQMETLTVQVSKLREVLQQPPQDYSETAAEKMISQFHAVYTTLQQIAWVPPASAAQKELMIAVTRMKRANNMMNDIRFYVQQLVDSCYHKVIDRDYVAQQVEKERLLRQREELELKRKQLEHELAVIKKEEEQLRAERLRQRAALFQDDTKAATEAAWEQNERVRKEAELKIAEAEREKAKYDAIQRMHETPLAEQIDLLIHRLNNTSQDEFNQLQNALLQLLKTTEDKQAAYQLPPLQHLATIPEDLQWINQVDALMTLIANKIRRINSDHQLTDEEKLSQIEVWENLRDEQLAVWNHHDEST